MNYLKTGIKLPQAASAILFYAGCPYIQHFWQQLPRQSVQVCSRQQQLPCFSLFGQPAAVTDFDMDHHTGRNTLQVTSRHLPKDNAGNRCLFLLFVQEPVYCRLNADAEPGQVMLLHNGRF